MRDVIVDTHALLWRFGDAGRLSRLARTAIDDASTVSVAAISFWEVGMLRAKGRIQLDRPTTTWRRDLLVDDRYREIDVTGTIGIVAAELDDFHGDPADRLIVACALAHDLPLVTIDQRIHDWSASARLDVVW